VIGLYADHETSGAYVHGRAEFARMIADAKAGKFDVILAEDVDRLARNTADTLQLLDRMEFIGIELHTVANGIVTEMHAMMKGYSSQQFLKSHAIKVRGGQAENVKEGRHAGGLAYDGGKIARQTAVQAGMNDHSFAGSLSHRVRAASPCWSPRDVSPIPPDIRTPAHCRRSRNTCTAGTCPTW
jgi:DNA invertase Pin-like site-specific DNA recombinase